MSDKPFINSETGHSLINQLLNEERFAGKLDDNSLDAFESLSAKQLLWVQGKAVQLGLLDEPASNEWSSKTLQERERIRGKEVPTPPVLLNRALRSPHRLHELEKK